jgi:hypothetical protein
LEGGDQRGQGADNALCVLPELAPAPLLVGLLGVDRGLLPLAGLGAPVLSFRRHRFTSSVLLAFLNGREPRARVLGVAPDARLAVFLLPLVESEFLKSPMGF